ncbi:MAG: MFS transporter [Roseateles depolymerans]|uniref:MFS transporter n=1 Tax=Roseateles depolymerans TaxID=76731 RepID=A0A2W5DJF9_9BURK|nr:MAG: MFS transporter [Roseateles depolymerans]
MPVVRTGASALPAILAGLAASLVGIGLARFAYTPLLPAMIHAQWFAASQVAFLGAANLAGYLIGALSGRAMARYASPVGVLRAMLLLASLAFVACAFPLSEAWFFAWRLMSGVAGGVIMVLVSSVVLHHVPAAQRGLASGAIFFGIGAGVAISGTLVPLVLAVSLRDTWLALGALSLLLTALSWAAWPSTAGDPPVPTLASMKRRRMPGPVRVLLAQYGLMALGVVPVMMFLVDDVSRAAGPGSSAGGVAWVAYGVGAMLGPLVYGGAADRWGARRAIRATLALQILAVLAFALDRQPATLIALAVVLGSFPVGAVPLALNRVHELVPEPHARQAMWSQATVSFALAQAVGGYVYSAVYAAMGGRPELSFWMAGAALLIALALDLRGRDAPARQGRPCAAA